MHTSYILTFIGDDRPGLVEALSRVVESHRGNWHESRLAQLGGKFAGLVLVSLPPENAAALESALQGLVDSGLEVQVTPSTEAAAPLEGRDVTLAVMGPDRLGIVREIARALAARSINVVEMDSRVEAAPMSGEALFHARIDARVPADTDLAELQDDLDDIAEQMTLDIELD